MAGWIDHISLQLHLFASQGWNSFSGTRQKRLRVVLTVRAAGNTCSTIQTDNRGYNLLYGNSGVLSLQEEDRRRRRARLLDDHRNGSDAGTLGRSAGCLGAAARDRRLLRRATSLRLAQIDHVLAQVLLLLRASEEELSRTLRVPRS